MEVRVAYRDGIIAERRRGKWRNRPVDASDLTDRDRSAHDIVRAVFGSISASDARDTHERTDRTRSPCAPAVPSGDLRDSYVEGGAHVQHAPLVALVSSTVIAPAARATQGSWKLRSGRCYQLSSKREPATQSSLPEAVRDLPPLTEEK